MQSHVPWARLVKELPHELVLALPYQGAPDSSFAELFCELDQRLGNLGLAGFGISTPAWRRCGSWGRCGGAGRRAAWRRWYLEG